MALSTFKVPSSLSSHPQNNPFNNQSDSLIEDNIMKWTNVLLGWQRRWVAIKGGLLIYSRPLTWREKKMKRFANGQLPQLGPDGSVWVHGAPGPALKIFFAKVRGFRESRSDGRKFIISTARKTVELKASKEQDRQGWIKALAHARDNSQASPITFRALRAHLFAKGLTVGLILDCEQIILREVTNALRQPGIETELEVAGQEILESGETLQGIGRGTEFQDSLKPEPQVAGQVIGEASRSIETGNSIVLHENPTATVEASEENEPMFFDAVDFLAEASQEPEPEYFDASDVIPDSTNQTAPGNSFMRAMKVVAFAVASYASYDGRSSKPFNPLLGETYEADFPEKGIRFIAEKVRHRPLTMDCHCKGRGWRFWGENTVRSKFSGQSIQLDPSGNLFVEFDDGEIFSWAKVNTAITNLMLGKPFCNVYGTMNVNGNRQFSCTLKFKGPSLLDRMPRKGRVTDLAGNEIAILKGDWNDNLYYEISKSRNHKERLDEGEFCLWKKNVSPAESTRYNFSSFGVTLNEITADLEGKIAPTDSSLRPDQRHLENGEYEKATVEKHRLEEKQRMEKDMDQGGAWRPRWFAWNGETFQYTGRYWQAKQHHDWSTCPDLFHNIASSSVTST